MSMIVYNETEPYYRYLPPYITADFLIRFANYGQYNNPNLNKLYKLLYNYSDSRYKDKSLAMNCWQFVLLCLLESQYLTEKDIQVLYLNYMSNKDENKRMPDYFGKKYKDDSTTKEPGDIILFQRKRDNIIWHSGILINIDAINIEYIDMLGYAVDITKHTIANVSDNMLFITPENLIEPIIKLNSEGIEITPATYDKYKLRFFLVSLYFKDEILEAIKSNRLSGKEKIENEILLKNELLDLVL